MKQWNYWVIIYRYSPINYRKAWNKYWKSHTWDSGTNVLVNSRLGQRHFTVIMKCMSISWLHQTSFLGSTQTHMFDVHPNRCFENVTFNRTISFRVFCLIFMFHISLTSFQLVFLIQHVPDLVAVNLSIIIVMSNETQLHVVIQINKS